MPPSRPPPADPGLVRPPPRPPAPPPVRPPTPLAPALATALAVALTATSPVDAASLWLPSVTSAERGGALAGVDGARDKSAAALLPPAARATPAAVKAAKAVADADRKAELKKAPTLATTTTPAKKGAAAATPPSTHVLTPAERRAKEEAERKEREAAKERAKAVEAAARAATQRRAVASGAAAALAAVIAVKGPVITGAAAVLFRNLGGPSLLAATLRAPGLLFGRVLRCVEWDAGASPDRIDGRLRSFRLRTATPDGLRAAIARAAGCAPGDVRQLAHMLAAPGGGALLEPIGSATAIAVLPDPALIVWSRRAPDDAPLPVDGLVPPAARPAAPAPKQAADADAALAALADALAEDADGGARVLAAAAAAPAGYAALWRAVGGERARFVAAARELAEHCDTIKDVD